jgi:glycosyltransferase involved in cell wall biosynthesis
MCQISVIIPVYNKCATLERALRSVIAQKNAKFEIILVDDGSTDGSISNLSNDLRGFFRLHQQANAGVSVARNKGVSLSNAPLIVFLDADDEFFPGTLEMFVGLSIEYPEAGFFSGTWDVVSESGVPYKLQGSWVPSRVEIVENFTLEYVRNTALVSSSSTCIRRAAFELVGGFPVGATVGEDIYFWIKLSETLKLCHSGQLISRVYRNSDNRSHQTSAGSGQIPYYLTYYLLCEPGFLRYRHDSGLRRLIYLLSVKSLLGAKESGSYGLVDGIIKAFLDKDRPVGLMFFALSKTPVRIIKILRLLRQIKK